MHCPNCDPNRITTSNDLLNNMISASDSPRFSLDNAKNLIDYIKNLIEKQNASILHGSENNDCHLLYLAIFRGNYPFIEYLLTDEFLKKDVHMLLTRKAFNKNQSLLYIACLMHKSADIAKLLLENGVDIDEGVIPLIERSIEWSINYHMSPSNELRIFEEVDKWKHLLDLVKKNLIVKKLNCKKT